MSSSLFKNTVTGDDGQPLPEEVTLQAVKWLVALQAADADEKTRSAWMHWRGAHPDHELAWLHIEQLGSQLRGSHAPLLSDALSRADMNRNGRRQTLKVLSGLMVVGAGAWMLSTTVSWQRWQADHRTATGEQRRLALPDGTEVLINSGSAIDVQFNQDERLVQLVAGEILVTSAPDPQMVQTGVFRPLIVQTAHGRLRALGTRFGVRQFDTTTTVSVLEGAVEVTPFDAASNRRVVQQEEHLRFSRSSCFDVVALQAADVAWSSGLLIARDMPLSEFLSELSRYRPGWLHCDPALDNLKVSGIYPVNDTDRVLDMLVTAHQLELRVRSRYWVSLVPGPKHQS